MSLLQWKPEYSVGIASMDDEHQEMIDLINDLYEKLDARSSQYEIEECLGDIFNTISAHFALEEKLMRAARYDDYDAHKNDHENLLDELRDLMDEFIDRPTTGPARLENELSAWFSNHFATHDARLHGKLGI